MLYIEYLNLSERQYLHRAHVPAGSFWPEEPTLVTRRNAQANVKLLGAFFVHFQFAFQYFQMIIFVRGIDVDTFTFGTC